MEVLTAVSEIKISSLENLGKEKLWVFKRLAEIR